MNRNDQEFLVQKIRTQYTEKDDSPLSELKKMDSRVKKPAYIFAYVFGIIGAVVMGSGMSLVMTDIGLTVGIESPMLPGIVIGVVGMIMTIVNYPIYKKILVSRRRKFTGRIIDISDRIMKE